MATEVNTITKNTVIEFHNDETAEVTSQTVGEYLQEVLNTKQTLLNLVLEVQDGEMVGGQGEQLLYLTGKAMGALEIIADTLGVER